MVNFELERVRFTVYDHKEGKFVNISVVAWDLLCMYVGLQFARARRSWLCVLYSGPNTFGQVIMPLRLSSDVTSDKGTSSNRNLNAVIHVVQMSE